MRASRAPTSCSSRVSEASSIEHSRPRRSCGDSSATIRPAPQSGRSACGSGRQASSRFASTTTGVGTRASTSASTRGPASGSRGRIAASSRTAGCTSGSRGNCSTSPVTSVLRAWTRRASRRTLRARPTSFAPDRDAARVAGKRNEAAPGESEGTASWSTGFAGVETMPATGSWVASSRRILVARGEPHTSSERSWSDAPAPAREHVLDVGALGAGSEHEEAVAWLDDGAAARRDRRRGPARRPRRSRSAAIPVRAPRSRRSRDRKRPRSRSDRASSAPRPRAEVRGRAAPARAARALPATRSSVHPCRIVETTTTKKTALKITLECGTCEESANVASTIGTAPRRPAQPSSSRSDAVKSLNAVDAQTAAGRTTRTSSSASARPEAATAGSSLGKTSRPSTMNRVTCARNAMPSWKATSCRR